MNITADESVSIRPAFESSPLMIHFRAKLKRNADETVFCLPTGTLL
jgi:hypothetical protein